MPPIFTHRIHNQPGFHTDLYDTIKGDNINLTRFIRSNRNGQNDTIFIEGNTRYFPGKYGYDSKKKQFNKELLNSSTNETDYNSFDRLQKLIANDGQYIVPENTLQKKQQGGQLNMDEKQLQEAFIQFLAKKTGAKNQKELETAIQKMGEDGVKAAYQEFMQLIQQQQAQYAKLGAKLNYMKTLRGQCPEGYELSYYKVGGKMCKKCMKKKQDGGEMPEDPIDQFKCGRKMKKKPAKKLDGGDIDYDKCGGKTKKKIKKKEEGGGLNSTYDPNSFDKMTLAKCGTKLKEACKGMKMKTSDKKWKPKK